MSVSVVAKALRLDGMLRVEIWADGAFFRYRADEWMTWPSDHPIAEGEPGHWSLGDVSGFYDSLHAAMRDASAEHRVTFEETI